MLRLLALLVPFLCIVNAAHSQAPSAEIPSLEELRYRCVGPTRGGRATTVTGVAQKPGTFYMGATGGGVWKTEDYGQGWANVSDGFFSTPSIGAIRTGPTDPDLVWVGTGSDGLRSNVIPGRGVYRSDDAGKTWKFMGLEKTAHIGAVEIHPTQSDTVFVAAIGNAFAANEERGVYRTKDGGATWQRVFHISDTCGAVDLEFHPANPDVIYASMWEAERKPWTIVSGGTQGGVWRSEDGGDTWKKLEGGLPTGIVGKSDLAVSFEDPDRLYVLIEAKEKAGLYRSDDRGETFRIVSDRSSLLDRPFYYCNVDASPADADHLFVNATGFWESKNGGADWRRRSTPHGDNHDIWLQPDDPDVWVQANDGGANVTRDSGRNWSTQHNQPTAELYQIAVDDRYPYWLYAGQQDNSTIRVPSMPPGPMTGGATGLWESVGGCETGPAIPKPGDPDIVYANCKGRFGVYNHRTGQERQYYVGAANMYGHDPKDLQYRFQRVAPIHISPHDPNRVYHCSQFVHVTTDDGRTWETISPDLTAFDPKTQGISGSPITRDITGEEFYSTIYEIAESPIVSGIIWVGANDGPIHITRDGGENWRNVTPEMPGGGRVQTVEPSRYNEGVAYATVLRYQLGDSAPYVFRTGDYGATWTHITKGLPENCPARVVREDPRNPNVLYLGTEWGMYVSWDQGQNWRPFQQNLPVTPITDMLIHRDDLVVSTMGRSFWILDDISAVRAFVEKDAGTKTAMLSPRQAVRSRMGRRGGRGVPSYSGGGAILHYHLAEDAKAVKVEIMTRTRGEPQVVRAFSSERGGERTESGQGMRAPFRRRSGSPRLATTVGLHRMVWDMRREGVRGRGPLVAPGTYIVRLTVGDETSEAVLNVVLDPRVAAAGISTADLAAQSDLILRVQRAQVRASGLVDQIKERLEAEGEDGSQRDAVAALQERLVTKRGRYRQPMVVDQLRYLASMIDRADQRPGRDAYLRLQQLEGELAEVQNGLTELR